MDGRGGAVGRVDFAILAIRSDEYQAVLKYFPIARTVNGRRAYDISDVLTTDGTQYSVAVIRAHEQGHGAAQAAASDVLADLEPSWLVLVGIAGAVPEFEFCLGDVLVATRVHDFCVTAAQSDGSRPISARGGPAHKAVQDLAVRLPAIEPRLSGWNSVENLGLPRPSVDISEGALFGNPEWKDRLKAVLNHHFGPSAKRGNSQPVATAAAIASGNVLMKDPAALEGWLTHAREIKAVEMELPGVFEAARGHLGDKPVLAIRGISDIVGFKRAPEWTAYACMTAAALAHALIRSRPIDPVRSGPAQVESANRAATKNAQEVTPPGRYAFELEAYAVLWRLPRGFIVLSDLRDQGDSWGAVADYYDYTGQWRGGTHYHDSYRWRRPDDFETQSHKLHVEPADRYFAQSPLQYLVDVREGRVVLSPDGQLLTHGAPARLPEWASFHAPGQVEVLLPSGELERYARTGEIRDLTYEAHVLAAANCKPSSMDDWILEVESLRRRLRLVLAQFFPDSRHPVRLNAEDLIGNPIGDSATTVRRWLRSAEQLLIESTKAV